MCDLQHSPLTENTLRALEWFRHSGIQEPSGGVARYHLLAEGRNLPLSTEITGYAVSALVWAGDLPNAFRAADWLCHTAWQPHLGAMPFEVGEPLPPAYFFDCGIIIRGLLAAWRAGGSAEYVKIARETAHFMRFFWSKTGDLHPILTLPDGVPEPYEHRWSREPGCLQLKSALAWKNLAPLFPGEPFGAWWERALSNALRTEATFLPGESNEIKVMDRLHAYSYYLEALLSVTHRADVRQSLRAGIARAAGLLREISPQFERSDVCAQILRVRLLADRAGAVPLDRAAAEEEATRAAAHQRFGGPPMIDGGYGFGTRNGEPLPFMNPVSTAFAMQATQWWADWTAGQFRGTLDELI